ncbi:MAG: BamA/TamA family outer membrane protein [Myxococcota bacterium]
MLATFFGLGVAAGATPDSPDAEPDPNRRTWFVLPYASGDSDDGLGFGAGFELARLSESHEPYRRAIMVRSYTTVRGFHNHRVIYDELGLGPRGRGRLTVRLVWRQWLNDRYFGIGNGTLRDEDRVGPFERDDPARRFYRYTLIQPFAHLMWRQDLDDRSEWQVFGVLNPKRSVVRPYADSLLEAEEPYGTLGGWSVQFHGGFLHDTRAPELTPYQGHLLELSGRWAPDIGGEAGGFGGVLTSFRGFFGTPRAAVATRVMAEWLFGRIPFYEMVHWGGAFPIAGVGGFATIRGLRFGRVRAPGKVVANFETRFRVVTVNIRSLPIGLELAPYVDAGAVWGAEEPVPWPLVVHPGAGLGIGLVLDETFVGRLDTAVAYDPVRQADGSVRPATTFGVYTNFGYAF